MAIKIATRGAQYPLLATFRFSFNDTFLDENKVSKDFKTVGTTFMDAIKFPANGIVIGGEVVTEVAVTGSAAYNVSVGDSNNATRYLGATNRATAGRTPLVPTGYVGVGEDIRITVSPTTADATAGTIAVRVMYVIVDRMNESQTN